MEMKGKIMNTVSNLGTNKEGTAAVRIPKMKKLNGRSYKEWMKSLAKAKRSDPSIQRKRKLSEMNDTEPNGSEEDDKTNSDSIVSNTQQQRVDFLLRRVKNSSDAEKSNILNDTTRTKLQKTKNHISENQCNMDGFKLQEKYTHSAANARTIKFVEYWVPVRLSNVQMELYCGSLFSNSGVLCSSTKLFYKKETLHNILVSTRKCCDHPKLVDSSLAESFLRRIPEPEKYDVEIKLSSKLLLLHKILQEISKRGLRVVILYQTLGDPGSVHTGDILDDIIHENIGEDSFVYISEGLSKSKLQEACNTYNDKGSGKFICLMTTRACIPSVHLQSVDIVIFFNSDWDPTNDLRALQKIKLDSQLEHVKVFRLYSAYTVEEKLLMLAKESNSPESNVMNIRQSTCHGLLNWGAFYLFEKLDKFHGLTSDDTHSDADSFVEDVFLELSNLLLNTEEEMSGRSDTSFIVEVEKIGGLYPRNILLLGEKEYPLMKNYSVVEEMILKEPPYVFWTNILQGRKPVWKYFSSQSPRTRKCVQRSDIFETPVQARASKKFQTEASTRSLCELQSPDKEGLLPGEAAAPRTRKTPMLGNPSPTEPCSMDEQDLQTAHKASSSRKNVSPSPLKSQSPEASKLTQSQELQELQRELERLEKQKQELLKQHEDKKLQAKMARDKEIDEIEKKYEAVLVNEDIGFVEERQVLDTTYNKVLVKKTLLAEAMLQREKSENADLPRAGAGEHMRGSSKNLTSPHQNSEASPSLHHLSVSPVDPMLKLVNVQPSFQMTGPAPHFRHMACGLPSTPPLLPSHHPQISFSTVILQQVLLPNARRRQVRP